MKWLKTKTSANRWEGQLAVARGEDPLLVAGQNAPAGSGAAKLVALAADLGAELVGLGPLARHVADPQVTDILVNGTDQVWIDRGRGLELTETKLDPGQDRTLAVRMAAACGKRLDEAAPIVDGTLPNGARLHAVIPPLSGTQTLISLRLKRAKAFTLPQLVETGMVATPVASLLRALVEKRCSVLISGATGSGKTTLLNTLLGLVDPTQRLVCIEEVSEIQVDHPHVVQLQERRPNIQGKGEVTMSELVRAAMRMRPDRIVLGECRGAEVREVLLALNTGHSGGWATLHANSASDVPARLQALGALAGMSERAVTTQAAAGLDAVLHIARRADEDGTRRRYLSEIGVFVQSENNLECRVAVQVTTLGEVKTGPGFPALRQRLELSKEVLDDLR